jgi:hypothetical protein
MTNMTATDPLVDRAIEACLQCLRWCSACVDEGLNDPSKMAASIRLCHECAPVCSVCASLLSSNSKFAHELCAICADICGSVPRLAPVVLPCAARSPKPDPFERPRRKLQLWSAFQSRNTLLKHSFMCHFEGDSQHTGPLA